MLEVLVGLLPGLIWLSFYLKEDLHPEPKRLLLLTFLAGAGFSVIALVLQLAVNNFLPPLNFAPTSFSLREIVTLVLPLFILAAIEEFRFDCCIGGARRDEEKARAKERVYSHRDEFGQWDPKMQRPELWSLYNGRIHQGEHMRIFPLSNWTELDIWHYLHREEIEIPSIYFAHEREVVERDGMLLSVGPEIQPKGNETPLKKMVRFRTVGDRTQTGCVESEATDTAAIIDEIAIAKVTERGATRGDDRFSEAAMEDRKKEGYF